MVEILKDKGKIRVKFEDIKFKEKENEVVVFIYEMLFFKVEKEEFLRLGKIKSIEEESILFEKESDAERFLKKFYFLYLSKLHNLKNKLTQRDATFITSESSIPLLGTIYFGFIDRNTNFIEVRPNTSCNIACIYCSVDESPFKDKKRDFFVEVNYMLEWARYIAKHKEGLPLEFMINPQGEPTLYTKLKELVKGLANIEDVKRVSIVTNALNLTREKIKVLERAGLNRAYISLDALDKELAKKLAGGLYYNTDKVKELIEFILSNTEIDLFITPVWLKGINDKGVEEVVAFASEMEKTYRPLKVLVQNFLSYKGGRSPVKEASWPEFYNFLERLEKKYGMKLRLSEKESEFVRAKPWKVNIKVGQIYRGEVVSYGRLPNQVIVSLENRAVVVNKKMGKDIKIGQKIKFKVTKAKDNLYYGVYL